MVMYWTEEVERHLGRSMEPEEAIQWIIDQYEEGRSTKQIAKDLRTSYPTVSKLLRVFGVKIRSRGGPRNVVNAPVTKEECESFSYNDLGKKYNVSIWTIRNRCLALGVKKGEKNVDL